MSQLEKLIEKICTARADVRFDDLQKILSHYGYVHVRHKGSHFYFQKPSAPSLTIPVHNGKVKVVYVKEIIKLTTI